MARSNRQSYGVAGSANSSESQVPRHSCEARQNLPAELKSGQSGQRQPGDLQTGAPI
jgi:hypothetical protein